MCNVLLISTEQWIDLALFNCEDISFTQHLPDYVPEIIEMKFEHRWYIAGYPNVQSCSCQFRIRPLELGFNPPEDWFCEDEQAIKATKIPSRSRTFSVTLVAMKLNTSSGITIPS